MTVPTAANGGLVSSDGGAGDDISRQLQAVSLTAGAVTMKPTEDWRALN